MRPFVRPLTRAEIESPAFWTLLHEAAGVADDALRHIRETELAALEVIGVTDGEVIAFAAFTVTADQLTLEYIAVDAGSRGRGIGACLVDTIRSAHPGLPLLAETDNDAVDFYRALGFTVEPRPTDPRWPGRPRYRCTLGASSA
ncbi:MAG: GNAT family N-acetyltransferase [Propionibacterium sp.]|nr:GNAT family N-acetyltransferase [Propionibacterium sp.]